MTTGIDESFGKYRLRERLALGGMAEVFLATVHGEAGFVKPVVIKRIHPRMSADHDLRPDADRRGPHHRPAEPLQHLPGAGPRLGGRLPTTSPWSTSRARIVRTIQDLCLRREVGAADARRPSSSWPRCWRGSTTPTARPGSDGRPLGIVHRDVSPPNILVSYEGEVKIIDFGIAKARIRLVQTEAGVIKGKFRYMSPEQASGAEMDHRTDIFAAGGGALRAAAGRAPRPGPLRPEAMLRKMRKADFRPLRDYRPEIPPDLEGIVMKALSLAPRRSLCHRRGLSRRPAPAARGQRSRGPRSPR